MTLSTNINTSPTPTSQTVRITPSRGGLGIPITIGITLGSVLAITISLLLLYMCYRRRNKKYLRNTTQGDLDTSGNDIPNAGIISEKKVMGSQNAVSRESEGGMMPGIAELPSPTVENGMVKREVFEIGG